MVASGSRDLGGSMLGKSTPGTSTTVASDSKGGLEPALSPFAGTLTPGDPAAFFRFGGSIREFGSVIVRLGRGHTEEPEKHTAKGQRKSIEYIPQKRTLGEERQAARI